MAIPEGIEEEFKFMNVKRAMLVCRVIASRVGYDSDEADKGDSMDQHVGHENGKTNDFIILDHHVEAEDQLPKKAKLFFAYAADKWDAEFYAKVNDDVYVNIDALGATLATHLDQRKSQDLVHEKVIFNFYLSILLI